MSLEFQKGRYISRIWFMHHPDAGLDVQASLWRDLPDGLWHFDYRFRYYVDDKAHGSSDRKSGYKGTFPQALTEPQVLQKLAPALEALPTMLGEMFGTPTFEIDCCEIGTDEPRDVIRLLSLKPWANLTFQKAAD